MLVKLLAGLKLFGFIALIFVICGGFTYILVKIEEKWGRKYAYIAFVLAIFAFCIYSGFRM